MRITLAFMLAMLLLLPAAFAQEIEIHGFAQANYSFRIVDSEGAPELMGAHDKDIILGDERLQLEFSQFSATGNASFSAKTDLVRDALDSQMRLDLREAYLNLSARKFDIRIGRQIITWGLGDLVFINDTFPKDWVAFLSGQPLQYLKFGSDALSVSFHSGLVSAQAILMPFFEPDNLPTGERLFFYNPLLPQVKSMETRRPTRQFENFEVAGRLYRTLWKFDLSLYGYRGFYRTPAMQFDPGTGHLVLLYPELGVYGASFQGSLLGGVLSMEGGYYDSLEDRDGDNPSVENAQAKFLAGYQRAFGADLTVGVQYYGEAMLKHDEYERSVQPMRQLIPDFPSRKQIRHNITLRVMQFLKYQTLRLSLFAWVSPNDQDYYVNPEIRYSFTDELWAALGGNIFGGSENHTFFGQFEQNDSVYLTVRYGF